MIGVGFLIAWMLFDTKDTRRKRNLLFAAGASMLGVFALGLNYIRANQETCLISDGWVRFYDMPEMCSMAVIDRLSVDSETNGDPRPWEPTEEQMNEIIESEKQIPMAVDQTVTTEDGFDGDPPTT